MSWNRPFLFCQIRQTWKEAPIAGGQLDYEKFTRLIKRGKDAEE